MLKKWVETELWFLVVISWNSNKTKKVVKFVPHSLLPPFFPLPKGDGSKNLPCFFVIPRLSKFDVVTRVR